jgi:hypothetical protein
MADTPPPITPEEKQAATERVLQSRALGRSDQLRAFLRYVCEADLEGRVHEVNEYALGVFALGRPAGYSPAEDSCVRSRAYELRSKLAHYYESEAPDDPIRIRIPKGSYAPLFERSRSASAAEANATPGSRKQPTELVRALWEPFLGEGPPLLIVFEVRLFFHAIPTGLVVRHYRTNTVGEIPNSKPLEVFQERMGVEELSARRDYADFGTVHAAFLLGRLLSYSDREVGMKHAESLDWQDVWHNNIVYIGKPRANPIISTFLESKAFVVDDEGVIINPEPREGEASKYVSAGTHGVGEKYAMITRVPGPQPGRHMLLLTGAGAEFMWALGEAVTNPERVEEFMARMRTPSGEFPDAFQVVIRASFQSNVPLEVRYVTHRVLSGPPAAD